MKESIFLKPYIHDTIFVGEGLVEGWLNQRS